MGQPKRSRQYAFLVRLKDDEMKQLTANHVRAGLSREAYIRRVLAGVEIKEIPPLEYHELKNDLLKIGRNLNQIARIANATHDIRQQYYDQQVEKLNEMLTKIDQVLHNNQ
jgi:hypothetical protein